MLMLLEVIVILLMITLALFIHEMGHALALIMSDKKAKTEIYLGSSSKEKKLKFRIGRITCYVNIAISGFCQYSNLEESAPPSQKQRLIFAAGGPIGSLLGFATLFFLSTFLSGVAASIIGGVAVISLVTFFATAFPYTYPSFLKTIGGHQSDGLNILNILKK